MSGKSEEKQPLENSEEDKKLTCGIIMPIAGNQEYGTDHWKDVLAILLDAIQKTAMFTPKLVSDDVAIGLIHERIVNNIYSNEIVVCDVSSKNPNVMFELGMRLAFDKPTIIIKDQDTGYSFDTGVVEHLNYPRSLRYADIVIFKETLATKIIETYRKSQSEKDFSPFLKSFGKTIKPAKINETEITQGEFIATELGRLSKEVRSLRRERYLSINHPEIVREGNLVEFVRNKFKEIVAKRPGLSSNSIMSEVAFDLKQMGYSLSEAELSNIFSTIINE
jgi:hypothetical protein